jgi:hypothetical protein
MCKGEDVRTCFNIVRETDVLERPVWLLKQSYVSNRAEVIRQMLSTQVQWPENTEILLADMPPSTASEVFSFFDNMESLLGCIIVTQPSEISALGMTRTIDFLRHKEIPIMGLVTMMDGYLCPSCGLVSHQLLSPKLAMEKVAKDCGVPFLISIPQTPDVGLLVGLLGCLIVTQPSEISALGMRHIVDTLRLLGGSHDAICARIAERQATSFFPPSSPWTPLLGCVIRLQSLQRGP